MNTLRQAAQQALEAMLNFPDDISDEMFESITALKASLAEPVQEPVAWRYKGDPWFDGNRWHANFEVTTDERLAKFKDKHATPLYTAPPQRKPLTDEEIKRLVSNDMVQFARAIERAHEICE